MKKLMIVTSIVLLTIGFSVLPAFAYTNLGGGAVSISASGTLSGSAITFSANCYDAGTADTGGGLTIPFGTISTTPTDLTNSNRVIRMTGGTNYVDARIIIYTDNKFNTT